MLLAPRVFGAQPMPLAARAQQSDRVYRVGMLTGQPETDPENASRLGAFRQALGKFGWSEGRNLLVDIRWGAGDPGRMRVLAKELNGLAPDIVVAESTPATAALRQEIPNVPIVFSQVANPVGAGFAASLARPGGNIIAHNRAGLLHFREVLSATNGHAAAAPPRRVMNSRRPIIRSPRRRARATCRGVRGRGPSRS
jgi:hypothetical protein